MTPEQTSMFAKRHKSERIFVRLGLAATLSSVAILVLLLSYMFVLGISVLQETHIFVPIANDDDRKQSQWSKEILEVIPTASRTEKKYVLGLFTRDIVNNHSLASLEQEGSWILASGLVDAWAKGKYDIDQSEDQRPIKDFQLNLLNKWEEKGFIKQQFATNFFKNPDSRYSELAGIAGALKGTMLTLFVTFIISFPMGVLAALYLEEFAKPSRLNRFIELNINNLAAVPSIIFGLLGLAVLLNGFGLPRSAPLVGGMVLSMMVLPVIIISSRSSIQAVPSSLREGAFGLGASHMQTILHFVLPQSMPGIMTGSLLGMARALGETAPLLMIGMVSFISAIPEDATSPASVLSVQIFLWADSPERSYLERTSGAILLLLTFLIMMNLLSQLIRYRFEKSR